MSINFSSTKFVMHMDLAYTFISEPVNINYQ